MLSTLLKIGQWQSEGMTEWGRFIDAPKIVRENKKKGKITNYVVGLVFDLDEQRVYLDRNTLKEYDEEKDPKRFMSLKVQGGNNKAIYVTAEPSKVIQIFKTFFGKPDGENVSKGELIEAIDKGFSELKNSRLHEIAENIFTLRNPFLEMVTIEEKGEKSIDFKKLFENILGSNEHLVLVYACIKSAKFGFHEITPLAQVEDYLELLKAKFFAMPTTQSKQQKLCYASGELREDVEALSLTTRYSLNKMFVTETKNYASLFDENLFSHNYQLSTDNQGSLDIASTFLLNNYKVRIAGLDHVLLPLFLDSSKIDWEMALDKLKTDSDLLFSFNALSELTKNIESKIADTYWITFLAFESDGNFFKTINLIKDVSKFHFQHVIETFQQVDWQMREMKEVLDWDAASMDYGKIGQFNLNSVYGLIPIRKDKEKRNKALLLFKAILENRKIELQQILSYFTELVSCHQYQRYASYTNIKEYGNEYFGIAIRDSVFKYHAFIQVLTKLNLINMEQPTQPNSREDAGNDYEKSIADFFLKMQFTSPQKAMFFLGRMLNSVAYLQKDKSKTVIDKVNYHGMDKDDIVRLRKDLFEKAKQYGKPEKIIFNDSQFGSHFDFNNWNMSPEESVFFLLTGYSFGIIKKDSQS